MLLALTGATGFIGQQLLRELPKRGYRLRVLLRRTCVFIRRRLRMGVPLRAYPDRMSSLRKREVLAERVSLARRSPKLSPQMPSVRFPT